MKTRIFFKISFYETEFIINFQIWNYNNAHKHKLKLQMAEIHV